MRCFCVAGKNTKRTPEPNKGNTAGTGPPSEYVTSVLAFLIKHTTQRPVPEVVWSFVQFIPDTSWPGFAYFLKHPKTFEQ